MTDYKTMYTILCGACSDAIDVLRLGQVQTNVINEAQKILAKAMNEAEDIYIDTCGGESAK